jgi:hypothetical protein
MQPSHLALTHAAILLSPPTAWLGTLDVKSHPSGTCLGVFDSFNSLQVCYEQRLLFVCINIYQLVPRPASRRRRLSIVLHVRKTKRVLPQSARFFLVVDTG